MLLKQTKTELGWGIRSVKVKTAILNRVFQVDLSKNVIADQRLEIGQWATELSERRAAQRERTASAIFW